MVGDFFFHREPKDLRQSAFYVQAGEEEEEDDDGSGGGLGR
jgi:hypothetical protein